MIERAEVFLGEQLAGEKPRATQTLQAAADRAKRR
jgi:hypothetical protein